jgi:hypothetical protein
MKNKPEKPLRTLTAVTLFAIAMALVESALVIHIWNHYYPDGFSFPLKILSQRILVMELFREIATIVMLSCVGYLAFRQPVMRFAVFLYTFAIWDIFYYLYLYLIAGFPATLLSWDLLFLVPHPWIGPVIAPMVNSLTMIILGLMIVYFGAKGRKAELTWLHWLLLISGALITIFTYTSDYFMYMNRHYSLSEIITLCPDNSVQQYAAAYLPSPFNWTLFIISETLYVAAIILYYNRQRKHQK